MFNPTARSAPLLMAWENGHQAAYGVPQFRVVMTDAERESATMFGGQKVKLTEGHRHTSAAIPSVLRYPPTWLVADRTDTTDGGRVQRHDAAAFVPMHTQDGRLVAELFQLSAAQTPNGQRFTLTSLDGRHTIATLTENDVTLHTVRLPIGLTEEHVARLAAGRYDRMHDDLTVKPGRFPSHHTLDLEASLRTRSQGHGLAIGRS